ncbi:MAG: hypothetical protein MJ252_04735, partial [archaeon]|nr:hypothetical protein [archaeon]
MSKQRKNPNEKEGEERKKFDNVDEDLFGDEGEEDEDKEEKDSLEEFEIGEKEPTEEKPSKGKGKGKDSLSGSSQSIKKEASKPVETPNPNEESAKLMEKQTFYYDTKDYKFKIETQLLLKPISKHKELIANFENKPVAFQVSMEDIDPCSVPKFTYSQDYTLEELQKSCKIFRLVDSIEEAAKEINYKLKTKSYSIRPVEGNEELNKICLAIDTQSTLSPELKLIVHRDTKFNDTDYIIRQLCEGVNMINKSIKELEKKTDELNEQIETAEKENDEMDKELEELLKDDGTDDIKDEDLKEDDEEDLKEDEKKEEEITK